MSEKDRMLSQNQGHFAMGAGRSSLEEGLFKAALDGDPAAARDLIALGANLNAKDKDGYRADEIVFLLPHPLPGHREVSELVTNARREANKVAAKAASTSTAPVLKKPFQSPEP